MADGGASYELAEYSTDFGGIVRRRWWAVLAGPLAGLCLAVGALHAIAPGYTSTASVIVQASGEDSVIANGRTSSPINLDTEAQIVTSAVVAEIAQQRLHSSEEPRALAKHVVVTVPANTSVLDISYSASNPAVAQRGAAAFAEAYLENRRSAAQAQTEGSVKNLESKVESLNVSLRTLTQQIAVLPVNSPARSYKAARKSLLVQQISGLNSQLATLVSGDLQGGKIITDAQLPKVPSSPNKKLLLASGLLAGILIGLIGAVVIDRRDHRLRTRDDVQRLGVSVLAREVVVPAPVGRSEVLLGQQGEPLRRLRNAVLAALPEHSGTIVVAGVSRHEAASSLAASLAVNTSRTGAKVCLVLANLATSVIDEALGLGDRVGLADLLQFDAKLDDVVVSISEVPNLSVIASGSLSGSADLGVVADLLQGDTFGAVIAELRERFDVVVVDVAPTALSADAETLAGCADGVLLVTTAKGTTRDELLDAVDGLDRTSARLLGAVVVSSKSVRRFGKGTRRAADPADRGGRRVSEPVSPGTATREVADAEVLVDATVRRERRKSERRALRSLQQDGA